MILVMNAHKDALCLCLQIGTTGRTSWASHDVPLMATAWMQVFSRAGDVKRIIMGLDKHQMTPCGFAFVVYYTRQDAEDAVKYISGTIMDDRPVRVDFDWGFKDGRQYGRGRSGGQVPCVLSNPRNIALRYVKAHKLYITFHRPLRGLSLSG